MEVKNLKNFLVQRKKLLFILILIILPVLIMDVFKNSHRGEYLEVVYLDIGQGDSILIKDKEGVNFLIDAGSGSVTTQKIQKELNLFNNKLDAVLITHPDSDHAGGFNELYNRINVKNTVISSEDDYLEHVKDNILNVSSVNNLNQIRLSNNILLDILSPKKGMIADGNAKSIVNTMQYGNFNFIFTGDADSETERRLVSQGYFDKNDNKNLVNILKVGHHGSDTSSSELFLKKIKPSYCIISVGINNTYGHPSKNAMARLEKYCKNIYRTDLDGKISFKTNGKSLEISEER